MTVALASAVFFTGCKKDKYRLVKVESYEGEVSVARDDEDVEVFEGMKLVSEDVVTVGEASSLELVVDSDKHLLAEENTSFELVATGSASSGSVKINIINGSALIEIENKLNDDSTFSVTTPNAAFSVRGTQFQVSYNKDKDTTIIVVMDGVVAAEYEGDIPSENIEAGEGRVVTQGQVADIDTWINGTSGNIEYTSAGAVAADNNDDSILAAYNQIISNMEEYIANESRLKADYVVRDYMYFDYDGDGSKEVILYLGYYDDEDTSLYLRDIVFLDYVEDKGGIDVRAINIGEGNDDCYYADYNGKLARYSWRTSPMESYIYVVEVTDEALTYVLADGFDEVISDPASIDLIPLPLYGEWEMLFADM